MNYIKIENSRQYVPGIYIIKSGCGKIYVGSAVQLRTRFMSHRKALQDNRHDNKRLQNYYNKYGPGCLTFETIELCDKNLLIEKEQHYIDKLNPFFNICRVAGATYGLKPWLGRKHSEETKDKIRATNIRVKSVTKNKRWKDRNEKIKIRMTGNQYWLGKKHKPETIANRTGSLNPNSRSIFCVDLSMRFETVNEAAAYFKVSKSAICNAISRGNKVLKKHTIQHADN